MVRRLLAKLCRFRLRLLQERNVRVGLLPERQKVLVSGPCARSVSARGQRPCQLEPGKGADGILQDDPTMADDLLKLDRRFRRLPGGQIRLAAHVCRVEASEIGGEGRSRKGEFVRERRL